MGGQAEVGRLVQTVLLSSQHRVIPCFMHGIHGATRVAPALWMGGLQRQETQSLLSHPLDDGSRGQAAG
ncbi:MAG: hypothetical protein H6875_11590 [Hyphomicrobiaceae bacterium]|nr:hypothetical protein [Hyphomicrobiaceae bacterium]